ncbi:hypothetical protein CKO28_17510 [Rhodovibrio sodomensis]|uniref:Antitoxin n=1 Tax=Rhodovibrio sodomensis TaxID=1088 RepID=A0ABS1DIK8_9PROT|nr:hypothetical protein [Rhodovibrio sodomensis]MBK1669836.1 hypothetical protein [Rhodovibrio sodomensis]
MTARDNPKWAEKLEERHGHHVRELRSEGLDGLADVIEAVSDGPDPEEIDLDAFTAPKHPGS